MLSKQVDGDDDATMRRGGLNGVSSASELGMTELKTEPMPCFCRPQAICVILRDCYVSVVVVLVVI